MNHHDLITAPLANSSQVPPRGRPIKFTPERIQQIGNLVERGKSREEIAELIEVTVGSLQVTCSKLEISLRRPRLDNGIRLLPRGKPVRSNGRSTSDPSCDVSMPLQPIGEGSWQNSQPGPPERTGHTTRHQQRPKTKEAVVECALVRSSGLESGTPLSVGVVYSHRSWDQTCSSYSDGCLATAFVQTSWSQLNSSLE